MITITEKAGSHLQSVSKGKDKVEDGKFDKINLVLKFKISETRPNKS